MSKILIIVESPSKCNKIEAILGDKYKVIASYGHLRQLNGLQSINIDDNFSPTFTNCPNKLKYIEKIEKEIKNASNVIIGTDNDREGEAIGWHLCDMFSLPITTPRIIFNEISSSALKHSILNPTEINMNLVKSQQTRQILDMLVGYTISPYLWKCFSKTYDSSLSAGRCQTPALRLIYDNHMEIQNNIGKTIYNTTGYFTSLNIAFELNSQIENINDVKNFLELCKTYEFIYSVNSPKRNIKNPPAPLTTSSLQQNASNELNLSPKDTMKYAQMLYENGLITYMRTDSKKYSSEFINKISKFILEQYGEKFVSLNIKKLEEGISNKHNVQEAHESIRPVNITQDKIDKELKLPPKAVKLYTLIRNRTLESCMASAQYNTIVAKISAPNNLEFIHKTEDAIFTGWKEVCIKKNKTNIYTYLLQLNQYQKIKPNTIESKYTIINLKHHYTEARLVHLLEECGIGRPSTFASLIDKIQDRKYVEKRDIEGKTIKQLDFEMINNDIIETETEKTIGNEKNKLIITTLGKLVIEFLIDKFEHLFNYDYTEKLEYSLDNIAKGNDIWFNICKQCNDYLIQLTNNENLKNDKFSLKICENYELIIAKYGPVVKHKDKNDKITFLPVKKDLDIEQLRHSDNIKLDDILYIKDPVENVNSRLIGKYRGMDLYIKTGKYGLYANWGNTNVSLNTFQDVPMDKIEYIDVLKYLEKDLLINPKKPVSLLRELTNKLSIHSGKYGDYIQFVSSSRKRKGVEFFKLKSFKGNYLSCNKEVLINWIKTTYDIEV